MVQKTKDCVSRGVHSPLRPWCIPSVSDFPPVFKKFLDSEKNFKIFTFSWKISWFSSTKISDDRFFSHRPQILNFPLLSLFQYISTLFRENYSSPYFDKFPPPVLHKFTCFLHTLPVFRFPPTFTMMHLCITQCTYWTPLIRGANHFLK